MHPEGASNPLLGFRNVYLISVREVQLLIMTLFFLLVLYIFPYHFFADPYGINAIPGRPKMITPIGLIFQIRKLFEHSNRCAPFEYPDHIRNGYLWRYHCEQMYMLRSHIQFKYFTALLTRKILNTLNIRELFIVHPFCILKPELRTMSAAAGAAEPKVNPLDYVADFAIGYAHEIIGGTPGAATHTATKAVSWARRIVNSALVIAFLKVVPSPWIVHPLPDVTGHIVQAIAIGRIEVHRGRIGVPRQWIRAVPVICIRMGGYIPPRIPHACQAPSGRVLPLCLGGHSLAGPGALLSGHIDVYKDHWIVVIVGIAVIGRP